MIEDSVDGCIVPCSDVDALAAAMKSYLEEPDLMAVRGEHAKQKGQTFAGKNIVAKWEAYIKQICGA